MSLIPPPEGFHIAPRNPDGFGEIKRRPEPPLIGDKPGGRNLHVLHERAQRRVRLQLPTREATIRNTKPATKTQTSVPMYLPYPERTGFFRQTLVVTAPTGSTGSQKRAKPCRQPGETHLRCSGRRRASTARPHLRSARQPLARLRSLSARLGPRVATAGLGRPGLVAERWPSVLRECHSRVGSSCAERPQAQLPGSKNQEWVVS